MSSFSKNLVALRKAKNLTQKQASIAIGVDEENYQKLEFDMMEPDLQMLTKIADFYEVDPVDLRNGNLNITVPAKGAFGEVKNFVSNTTSDDLKSAATTKSDNVSPKSRGGAAALAWFLGAFGAHNFYLGNKGRAIGQLILTITCVGAVVSVVWSFVNLLWRYAAQ